LGFSPLPPLEGSWRRKAGPAEVAGVGAVRPAAVETGWPGRGGGALNRWVSEGVGGGGGSGGRRGSRRAGRRRLPARDELRAVGRGKKKEAAVWTEEEEDLSTVGLKSNGQKEFSKNTNRPRFV